MLADLTRLENAARLSMADLSAGDRVSPRLGMSGSLMTLAGFAVAAVAALALVSFG